MHFVFSFSISGFSNKVIPRTYQSPLVCSENKGTDQLRGYRTGDLRLCFSYDVAQIKQ